MAINLTRVTSRKVGAGKTTIMTAASIGHAVMNPTGLTWLVTPADHMVEQALHQMCSEAGVMPQNLRVTDERTFANMMKNPAWSLGNSEARAMDHVFYDALDQNNRNTILDGLIEFSEVSGRSIYVTVAEN